MCLDYRCLFSKVVMDWSTKFGFGPSQLLYILCGHMVCEYSPKFVGVFFKFFKFSVCFTEKNHQNLAQISGNEIFNSLKLITQWNFSEPTNQKIRFKPIHHYLKGLNAMSWVGIVSKYFHMCNVSVFLNFP